MAETIGKALEMLSRIGKFELTGIFMESNETVESMVNHKFKEEMIVPYVGITDNIRFMMTKGDRYVTTSDGARCRVIAMKEVHICVVENMVMKLYGIDAWTFIKRWYSTQKSMDSLHFLYLKLQKE